MRLVQMCWLGIRHTVAFMNPNINCDELQFETDSLDSWAVLLSLDTCSLSRQELQGSAGPDGRS